MDVIRGRLLQMAFPVAPRQPTYAPPRVFTPLVQITGAWRKGLAAKALRVMAQIVGCC
jgi:hypothetical protein